MFIHNTNFNIGVYIALIGRHPEPFQSLGIRLFDTLAFFIQQSKIVL